MDQKYLDQMKCFIEEVEYDYYAAQPAWYGHCLCYEFCDEMFLKMLGFLEIFDPDNYNSISELRKANFQEIRSLDQAIKDTSDNATAADLWHALENEDQRYWQHFDLCFQKFCAIYESLGGSLE